VAGESARFGITEVRRGLYPLAGSAVRLRRQIPYTLAAEILLTGSAISAQEALRIRARGSRGPRRAGAGEGPRAFAEKRKPKFTRS
jgi:1,4-dihydroxy-2-naphthoyl-CoA synthase